MSQDDPFAPLEGNRTIILPSPGGRSPAPPPGGASPTRPVAFEAPTQVPTIGLNPLLAAANPLLNLVPQLRSTLHP